MELSDEIWRTLSQIDVAQHTEKKGKFTYLSWAWAWGMFMDRYPHVEYSVADRFLPDGTAEVTCHMTVFKGEESCSRNMWLPVLDHNNKPVGKPNAFDLNTAKMRCLAKCLAMYGLGHYIYAGEDLPKKKSDAEYIDENKASIDAIKIAIEAGDISTAAEEWFTLTPDVKEGIWVAKSKGGAFSAKEREVIKSTEFRAAYYGEEKAA